MGHTADHRQIGRERNGMEREREEAGQMSEENGEDEVGVRERK